MRRLLVIGLAYGLAHHLGYVMRVPPANVAAVWPATGVALGALMITRPDRRWTTATVLVLVNLVNGLANNSAGAALSFLAANILETALALAVMTRLGRVPSPTLTSVSDVATLIATATLANGASAIVGGSVVTAAFGLPFREAYVAWWTSDGLGVLVVAPLLVLTTNAASWRTPTSWGRIGEAILFLAIWSAVGWVVFHVGTIGRVFVPLPYAMLALLTWAGLRFSPTVVATALALLMALSATSPLVGYGPSPLGGDTATARMHLLQAYLAVATCMGLVLVAVRRETLDALDAARDEQLRLQSLADHLPDGMVFELAVDPSGVRFLYASAGIAGIAAVDAIDVKRDARAFFDLVHVDDRPALAPLLRTADHRLDRVRADIRLVLADGSERWVNVSSSPRELPGQTVWYGIVTDITEQRTAETALRVSETRLREAEKTELVGRLAGGIAHDFNNLLTVITGYVELLLQDAPDDQRREALEEVGRAASRASVLTQKLLAVGRRTMLTPVVLDVNRLVQRTEPLIRRTLGESIALHLALAPGELRVQADPVELERVLLNLALNARDAMLDGGTMTISTGPCKWNGDDARAHGVAAGRYVMLSVTDTGVGISPALRARLFEPFFTTKPAGLGSGLGLAAVDGIVRQSLGCIDVRSSPGAGATFSVYLPVSDAPLGITPSGSLSLPRGRERILLVEDEPGVRQLIEKALQRLGYQVVTADSSDRAIAMAHSHVIDMLMTDVMLPGMSGPDLLVRLRRSHPGLRALFVSGYAEEAVFRRGVESHADFLRKPFSIGAMAAKVREVLDTGLPRETRSLERFEVN